jgi:nitrite reductase/ring-hydroxylating ferredoxin subunit
MPAGWFAVAETTDLGIGESKAAYYFGTHLALWRDETGEAHVMDAFCPHLGAHLGHGGTVDGCEIVCPFHGWKYDTDGRNTEIPYSERTNGKATIRTFPVLERNGLAHVEASANGLVFDGDRITPVFGSPAGEGCGECGSCKGAVMAQRRNGYDRTVFVGDGLSDRCGARAADVVYAKGDLAAWCARAGIAARPFATFADVMAAEGLPR